MLDENKLLNSLKAGEIVIIPTDTVYGISADATNVKAVEKVNQAKKRTVPKPLSLLVSDKEMLQKYITNPTPLERKIIAELMPDKVTVLFKKNELIPDEVTANSPFVAIRIPDNELLCELIKKFGKPIVSTSANITGSDVVANLDSLEDELKEKASYIWDIGELNTVPSTIIKVENEKIVFLREGIIASKIKEIFKDYI